ncbi:unnamed protein product [Alopecurus aequalis]
MYYRGWYHLFYQHNPKGAVKGDIIAWGHVVSKDLVRWRHLPLAMVPDHWYDVKGVMTGSTTVLPGGKVALLYTGNSNTSTQDHNGHAGIAMVYKTKDFVSYDLIPGFLHRVNGTGMWECVDFYPVGGSSDNSLEGALYVMKESSDDDRNDYYALGRYNSAANTWIPVDSEADLGVGLRYDWGKFYASKPFYDPAKRRRVLWGWVSETDSKRDDIIKGWGSLQSIPRTVALDEKTRTNLLQWPVEEIETLRLNAIDRSGIIMDIGSVIPIPLGQAAQLDIEASFRLNASAVTTLNEDEISYNCGTSGGGANRGALGPFGLLVLTTDNSRREQMAVYFYVSRDFDGSLQTHFCHDESRSSRARDVVMRVVGSTVPVLDGEVLSVRVLVDHSIVESFAMGGRLAITSRVYPTEAIHAATGLYVFNNATNSIITVEKLVVHEMHSSSINVHH